MEERRTASDPVNPAHYKRGPAEAIDVIEAAIADAPDPVSGYLQGQALKYLLRMWNKNCDLAAVDAAKAQWYLSRLLGKLEQ